MKALFAFDEVRDVAGFFERIEGVAQGLGFGSGLDPAYISALVPRNAFIGEFLGQRRKILAFFRALLRVDRLLFGVVLGALGVGGLLGFFIREANLAAPPQGHLLLVF